MSSFKPATTEEYEEFVKKAKSVEGWQIQFDSSNVKVWSQQVRQINPSPYLFQLFLESLVHLVLLTFFFSFLFLFCSKFSHKQLDAKHSHHKSTNKKKPDRECN